MESHSKQPEQLVPGSQVNLSRLKNLLNIQIKIDKDRSRVILRTRRVAHNLDDGSLKHKMHPPVAVYVCARVRLVC